jgi:ferredoxin, 2Fe-2S
MPMITYVEHNCTTHMVASPIGISLMEAATMHKVPGIEGDCGGFCACGTCHCYVAAEDAARLPEMHELERADARFCL